MIIENNNKIKILITSPSLNPLKNVSGISTVVNNIIKLNEFEFIHFQLARTDKTKRNLFWIFHQFKMVINFYNKLIKNKINIIHFNTDLTTVSIIRDFVLISITRLFKIERVLHIHGGKYLIQKCDNSIVNFFYKQNIKYSNYIIVLSDFEKSIIKEKFKVNNVITIPNSIDFSEIKINEFKKSSNLRFNIFWKNT